MINKDDIGSLPKNNKSGTYHIVDITRQTETNGVITQVRCQVKISQLNLLVTNAAKKVLYNDLIAHLNVLILMKIDKNQELKESIVINSNLDEQAMTANQKALINHYLKTALIPLLFALEKD